MFCSLLLTPLRAGLWGASPWWRLWQKASWTTRLRLTSCHTTSGRRSGSVSRRLEEEITDPTPQSTPKYVKFLKFLASSYLRTHFPATVLAKMDKAMVDLDSSKAKKIQLTSQNVHPLLLLSNQGTQGLQKVQLSRMLRIVRPRQRKWNVGWSDRRPLLLRKRAPVATRRDGVKLCGIIYNNSGSV